MIFEPEPGTSIKLNGESIEFVPLEAEGPAAVFVYAESGKEGTVYKVLKGQEFYALKVFYSQYRNKRLLENTKKLSRFKNLEGFRVAERTIINRQRFPEIVANYPELNYSVLMPWIEGTVWGNLMVQEDSSLSRENYFQIARTLTRVVHNLETKGVAHCDLSNNNFIIDQTLSSIQLVDIEDIYAPDMPRPIPDISYGTIGYRTKWIAQNGLWGPAADRFASAILCVELLTWHNKEIRENRAGDTSFFDEAEIGENSIRYNLMRRYLSAAGNDLQLLFKRAWFSEGFDQCPPLLEWTKALVNLDTPTIPAQEENEPLIEKKVIKERTKTNRRNDHAILKNTPPKMEISHSILDFGTLRDSETTLEFAIVNKGGSVLTGNIDSESWMEASPSRFAIPPGDSQTVTVSLNAEFPRPKTGLEYRTPSALVVESNAGGEIIGASYKMPEPSLYKTQFVWLLTGLIAALLFVTSFRKISFPSDFLSLVYFGVTGIIAGFATIKNFQKYQDILKTVIINGLIIGISFAIFISFSENMATALTWNSIFLTLLMVVVLQALDRDRAEMRHQASTVNERKVNKSANTRLRNTQRATGKSRAKAGVKNQSPVSSVYVFVDDGTPLYSSLPASNNWIVWLEKGTELSVMEPSEEKMTRIKKHGYYIEVVDNKGNKGFVTATAVKIKYT